MTAAASASREPATRIDQARSATGSASCAASSLPSPRIRASLQKRREDHIHDRRGRRTAGHQRARENITGSADIDRQLKARDKPADPVMPPGQAVNLWLPGPGRCGNRFVRRAHITADLVSNLVGKQFSQWARLPVRPVDAGGMDNMTFRLVLQSRFVIIQAFCLVRTERIS